MQSTQPFAQQRSNQSFANPGSRAAHFRPVQTMPLFYRQAPTAQYEQMLLKTLIAASLLNAMASAGSPPRFNQRFTPRPFMRCPPHQPHQQSQPQTRNFYSQPNINRTFFYQPKSNQTHFSNTHFTNNRPSPFNIPKSNGPTFNANFKPRASAFPNTTFFGARPQQSSASAQSGATQNQRTNGPQPHRFQQNRSHQHTGPQFHRSHESHQSAPNGIRPQNSVTAQLSNMESGLKAFENMVPAQDSITEKFTKIAAPKARKAVNNLRTAFNHFKTKVAQGTVTKNDVDQLRTAQNEASDRLKLLVHPDRNGGDHSKVNAFNSQMSDFTGALDTLTGGPGQ